MQEREREKEKESKRKSKRVREKDLITCQLRQDFSFPCFTPHLPFLPLTLTDFSLLFTHFLYSQRYVVTSEDGKEDGVDGGWRMCHHRQPEYSTLESA